MTLFDAKWAMSIIQVTAPSVISIMQRIIKAEGGFSNDPKDSGGATNYGVSLKTARRYGSSFDYDRDGVVSVNDIRKVTSLIATAFYIVEFFNKPNFIMLPSCIWPVVTDMSVNMSATQASLIVQHTAVSLGEHIIADGMIGPNTAQACKRIAARDNCKTLINSICQERERVYHVIVAKNPEDAKFLNGWLSRSKTYYV